MQYIFHRGFHETKREENTLAAFLKANADERCIGMETDVRTTRDHEFVLYHSPIFHDELVQNVFYKDMAKENVIRLEDLLKINTSKIILLEIKDFNLDIPKFLKILNKYPRQIYIMSFSNKVIKKLAKAKTKYKIGILNYVFNTINDYPYDFICLLNDVLSFKLIQDFQTKKVEVFSYGIRSFKDLHYANLTYIINNDLLPKA